MPTLQSIPINASSIGNNTIITGVSGQIIQVVGLFFQCNVATTLTIKSGATSLTGPMSFTGSGGLTLDTTFSDGNPVFTTDVGDSLIFYFSGLTGQAGGMVLYYQF